MSNIAFNCVIIRNFFNVVMNENINITLTLHYDVEHVMTIRM